MRDSLLRELQGCLEPEDLFVFLPVFYAGGSTSFKPSSQEVATVPRGNTIQVFEIVADGNWYRVGGMGYMHHSLLEKVSE